MHLVDMFKHWRKDLSVSVSVRPGEIECVKVPGRCLEQRLSAETRAAFARKFGIEGAKPSVTSAYCSACCAWKLLKGLCLKVDVSSQTNEHAGKPASVPLSGRGERNQRAACRLKRRGQLQKCRKEEG